MSGVFIVVGGMRSGKTTLLKNIMRNSNSEKFAFSIIKSDYEELKQYQNFETFVSLMDIKKDSVFVIDEAFTCLPDKLNVDTNPKHRRIAKILVNSGKLNNIIFIVFHNLQQVKKWLPAYTNFLIRFNTSDQMQYQLARFRSYAGLRYSLVHKPKFQNFVYSENCKIPIQDVHYHFIKMT